MIDFATHKIYYNDTESQERKGAKMAKRYTETQLWDFINRADTHEKVEIAADFITRMFDAGRADIDGDTYDDMMDALAFISRELYRADR